MSSQRDVYGQVDRGEARFPADGLMRPGGLELTERALGRLSIPAGKILDVGCGLGLTVEYLRGKGMDAAGIEPSTALIAAGRLRAPDLPLFQAQGEALPFDDASVSGILAECSLSLMQINQALAEFYRVLSPGGKLMVSDVYARDAEGLACLRRLPVAGCLAGLMTREEWEDKLAKHGFRVFAWEDCAKEWKRFVAGLILRSGALEEFWDAAAGSGARAVETAARQAGLGYFWLGAERGWTHD